MDKDRDEISQLTLIAARYEAICDILEGLEVSDFLESFPEVRKVADLYAASQQANSPDKTMPCVLCDTEATAKQWICSECVEKSPQANSPDAKQKCDFCGCVGYHKPLCLRIPC